MRILSEKQKLSLFFTGLVFFVSGLGCLLASVANENKFIMVLGACMLALGLTLLFVGALVMVKREIIEGDPEYADRCARLEDVICDRMIDHADFIVGSIEASRYAQEILQREI